MTDKPALFSDEDYLTAAVTILESSADHSENFRDALEKADPNNAEDRDKINNCAIVEIASQLGMLVRLKAIDLITDLQLEDEDDDDDDEYEEEEEEEYDD
jgi:hypothetical protein